MMTTGWVQFTRTWTAPQSWTSDSPLAGANFTWVHNCIWMLVFNIKNLAYIHFYKVHSWSWEPLLILWRTSSYIMCHPHSLQGLNNKCTHTFHIEIIETFAKLKTSIRVSMKQEPHTQNGNEGMYCIVPRRRDICKLMCHQGFWFFVGGQVHLSQFPEILQ